MPMILGSRNWYWLHRSSRPRVMGVPESVARHTEYCLSLSMVLVRIALKLLMRDDSSITSIMRPEARKLRAAIKALPDSALNASTFIVATRRARAYGLGVVTASGSGFLRPTFHTAA